MAESVTLNTPIAKPSVSGFTVTKVAIDREAQSVSAEYRFSDGSTGTSTWPTPAPAGSSRPSGATLITTLNKMNFNGGNPSFLRRVTQQILADGDVGAGTISGTPD